MMRLSLSWGGRSLLLGLGVSSWPKTRVLSALLAVHCCLLFWLLSPDSSTFHLQHQMCLIPGIRLISLCFPSGMYLLVISKSPGFLDQPRNFDIVGSVNYQAQLHLQTKFNYKSRGWEMIKRKKHLSLATADTSWPSLVIFPFLPVRVMSSWRFLLYQNSLAIIQKNK